MTDAAPISRTGLLPAAARERGIGPRMVGPPVSAGMVPGVPGRRA